MRAYLRVYRTMIRLLPADFRRRYGDEMVDIAGERVAEGGAMALLAECGSIASTAIRLHAQTAQLHLATAALLSLLVLSLRGSGPPVPSIEVTATDPAGEFTLVVRGGRAIAGTIDDHPLAREQLVHAGDSIRVVSRSGRVLFAVAYDADKSTIAWEPRPAACRGRVLDCGANK